MPFVRRRPLLRAAAVGGVAYMGAKAGTNHAMQQQAAAEQVPVQAPAPAPVAPTTVGDDTITRLTKLAELHSSGALTDEEFAAAKAQVLA